MTTEQRDPRLMPKTAPPGLAAALAALQAELPVVPKTKTADTGKYRYKYADYADVVAKLFPLMAKQGLSFSSQPTWSTELGRFGLAYQLLHTSGELLDGFFPIEIGGLSPQQIGSAITYARRYSLSAITGVASEEDDDAQAAQHGPQGGGQEARSARVQPQGPREAPGPQEPVQAPVADRDPEVQSLAEKALLLVGVGHATVAQLQEQVYDIAKAHRGWLTSKVAHPATGEVTVLSTIIRDAKTELEKQAAEAKSDG